MSIRFDSSFMEVDLDPDLLDVSVNIRDLTFGDDYDYFDYTLYTEQVQCIDRMGSNRSTVYCFI